MRALAPTSRMRAPLRRATSHASARIPTPRASSCVTDARSSASNRPVDSSRRAAQRSAAAPRSATRRPRHDKMVADPLLTVATSKAIGHAQLRREDGPESKFPLCRPRCAGQMPVATASLSHVSPVSLSLDMDNCPRIGTCRVRRRHYLGTSTNVELVSNTKTSPTIVGLIPPAGVTCCFEDQFGRLPNAKPVVCRKAEFATRSRRRFVGTNGAGHAPDPTTSQPSPHQLEKNHERSHRIA